MSGEHDARYVADHGELRSAGSFRTHFKVVPLMSLRGLSVIPFSGAWVRGVSC